MSIRRPDLNQDVILYHGSKDGIRGGIRPCSREQCDFGRGFYLGDSQDQTKGIAISGKNPHWYKAELHLSEIPNDKKIYVSGMEWLYIIMAYRDRIPDFSRLNMARELKQKYNQYDVIVGPIADDRMNIAIRRFEDDVITDVALMHCLSFVSYGNQYVLKTPDACSKVKIIQEKTLDDNDIKDATRYSEEKRAEGRNIVREMGRKYRTEGHVLSELIEIFMSQEHHTEKYYERNNYDER